MEQSQISPFEKDLTSTYTVLRRQAIMLTGNVEEANDLVQETVLKALKYRHLFQEHTNFSAWIYTIMRNTFITSRVTSKKLRAMIDIDIAQPYLKSKAVDNNAFTDFALEELKNALEKIEVSLRIPFTMHCRGFKYREIAEELDIPIGTVKNKIHMAKKELQVLLNSYKDLHLD